MKRTKTILIISSLIFSNSTMAQYQPADTSAKALTYKAGMLIEKAGKRQELGVIATLCGGILIAGGVSTSGSTTTTTNGITSTNNKNNEGATYYYVGGGLALVGIVLYLSGSAQLVKSGKYLQMATGHFPINYKKSIR